MENKIFNKIKEYDYIAIYRHVNPDFDAFGSQFGMYDMIKTTFPNKNVYVCGDFSSELVAKYKVDYNNKEVDYNHNVLGIILDTANIERIDDENYKRCKEIIKIDHHIVVDSYGSINYEDSSASSASQLVGTIYKKSHFKLSVAGASALYIGLIGDTSRFLFKSTDERTFDIAALLVARGVNITEIYNSLYLRKAKDLDINRFILNNYKYDGGVAYYILRQEDLDMLQISRERGSDYVNILSGIEEFKIWMAITENVVDNNWRVSLRSRDFAVNEVAQNYNGGGHRLASGARLTSLDQLDELVNDLKEKINERFK